MGTSTLKIWILLSDLSLYHLNLENLIKFCKILTVSIYQFWNIQSSNSGHCSKKQPATAYVVRTINCSVHKIYDAICFVINQTCMKRVKCKCIIINQTIPFNIAFQFHLKRKKKNMQPRMRPPTAYAATYECICGPTTYCTTYYIYGAVDGLNHMCSCIDCF